MVRAIAGLVGAAFVFVLALALFGTARDRIQTPPVETAPEVVEASHPLLRSSPWRSHS